jgi:hypothetical protein
MGLPDADTGRVQAPDASIIDHPLARTYYARHICVQMSRYCGTSG